MEKCKRRPTFNKNGAPIPPRSLGIEPCYLMRGVIYPEHARKIMVIAPTNLVNRNQLYDGRLAIYHSCI